MIQHKACVYFFRPRLQPTHTPNNVLPIHFSLAATLFRIHRSQNDTFDKYLIQRGNKKINNDSSNENRHDGIFRLRMHALKSSVGSQGEIESEKWSDQ